MILPGLFDGVCCSYDEREAALKQELENVRHINEVIEGVVDSLETAKTNMNVRNILPVTLSLLHPTQAPGRQVEQHMRWYSYYELALLTLCM